MSRSQICSVTKQANTDSILTTWVYVQQIMDRMTPGWRATAGLPATADLPVKYVNPIPDVDPEEFRLELASASKDPLHEDEVYRAPNRQPDPELYSTSSRTPGATPTQANVEGGGSTCRGHTITLLSNFFAIYTLLTGSIRPSRGLTSPGRHTTQPLRATSVGLHWQLAVAGSSPNTRARGNEADGRCGAHELDLSFISLVPAPAPPKEPELATRSPSDFPHTPAFLFPATNYWCTPTVPGEHVPAVGETASQHEPQPELRPEMSLHESEAVAVCARNAPASGQNSCHQPQWQEFSSVQPSS
jgi:hypothetical protein